MIIEQYSIEQMEELQWVCQEKLVTRNGRHPEKEKGEKQKKRAKTSTEIQQ